jgi:hypothetical protein
MRGILSMSHGIAWRVASVYVRTRDGHRRVETAYRILLTPNNLSQPVSQEAGSTDLKGQGDANRDLLPSLDRAPGT